jgi:hypothetical protein
MAKRSERITSTYLPTNAIRYDQIITTTLCPSFLPMWNYQQLKLLNFTKTLPMELWIHLTSILTPMLSSLPYSRDLPTLTTTVRPTFRIISTLCGPTSPTSNDPLLIQGVLTSRARVANRHLLVLRRVRL